jgi:hypothetical protein
MSKSPTNEVPRLAALGLAVLLEGVAILSAVLQSSLLPLGTVYPHVISVAVFVLPSLVGLLAQRLEVAILLAELPLWTLAVVYLATRAPLWTVDLLQLGVLAGRVAGVTFLLGGLSVLGWLLRRVILGQTIGIARARS